jgi:hypothetical protein
MPTQKNEGPGCNPQAQKPTPEGAINSASGDAKQAVLVDHAAQLAAEMVACASQQHSRTMSFSVMNDDKPVPFTTHWQHKNIAGVTFKKTDTAEAEAWITAAMLAGYDVCRHAGGPNSSGGVYSLERGQS